MFKLHMQRLDFSIKEEVKPEVCIIFGVHYYLRC